MAPTQPTLASLQKPLDPSEVQRQHLSTDPEYQDCTPCRLMGSAAFTGLGVYTAYSGMKQLRQHELEMEILRKGSRFGVGARKVAVLGTSAVLVGMGVYRLVR